MAKISGQKMTMPDGVTKCFVARMTWAELVKLARVDKWQAFDSDGVTTAAGSLPHGYQRPEEKGQIGQMTQGLRNGGWFFGAIVGNIRSDDLSRVLVNGGSIEVPDDIAIYLMDGQQRTAALRAFLREHPEFANREVLVQIFLGHDAMFEGKAFMMMNIGKTVPADLRSRLLSYFGHEDRQQMQQGEMPGISPALGVKFVKEAQAIDILEGLKLWNSPLYAYVRRPNENNAGVPLKQNSFVRSLIESKLFESGERFGTALDGTPALQAQIIDTFWKGVEQVWPQPFNEKGLSRNDRQYSLISAVCFIAMHSLLAEMLQTWQGEFTVARVAAILSRAKGNLDTSFWKASHRGDPMIGNSVEFWSCQNPMIRHKGNSEVRKELVEHLRQAICGDAKIETIVRETCSAQAA